MTTRFRALGFSYSDILDRSLFAKQRVCHRSLVNRHLELAASYRLESNLMSLYFTITDRTPNNCKVWAREHIAAARTINKQASALPR